MTKTTPGPVEFKIDQKLVHVNLVDGVLICSTFVSSADDDFHQAAMAHCDDSGLITGVELTMNFTLTSVLDGLLGGHDLYAKPGTTSEEARPLVDAMKLELEAMLERISKVKYNTQTGD